MSSQRLIRFVGLWTCVALITLATSANLARAKEPEHPKRISWKAAKMHAETEDQIDRAVAKSIDDGQMSGCVVLIGRQGGIVFEKAYGNRCVEPEKEPMTTDTLFDMASLTKPLATATSLMILLERGQLRLQDKVAKFFPDFAAKGKQDVTVEELLVHSSGLLPDNSLSDYSDGWNSAKPKICELSLLTEPGTHFKYSDVNYILLGKIVEAVSGEGEDQFTKREIYDKLGMRESGFLPSKDLQERAETTEKRDGKWLKGEVHDPRSAKLGGVAGHAGLFCTAEDLANYCTMMLKQGKYAGQRVLSPSTIAEMTRSRDINGQRRALGWDKQSGYSRNRSELMSDAAFGHGGFTGTSLWIDPQMNLYVIFLGDRLHPDGKGEVNDLAGRIGTMACASTKRTPKTRSETSKAAELSSLPGATATSETHRKSGGNVKLGIDVLIADNFKLVDGKRVGLITNQTGV